MRDDIVQKEPEINKEYWVFPITYSLTLCNSRFRTMFGRYPDEIFQRYGMIFAGPLNSDKRPRETWVTL